VDFGDNVWEVEWDEPDEWSEAAERAGYGGVLRKRLRRGPGAALSWAVWELEPGATQAPYHFHHGGEELLIVLRGTPTLRSPEGERVLREGEVVHFPRGPEGAHQLSNRSGEVARYVIAAALPTPEIVEYPDSGKIASMARTETTAGGPLFTLSRLADGVEYFDGESA
jgi:quercetin dioxygenase-like cupin family protein